jgi:hypothetical protein
MVTKADKPTSAATYERARRLANVSMFAVDLQVRRLQSTQPEDSRFLFRKWFDFDSLVVALTRLRRAAALAAKIAEVEKTMRGALTEFDSSLPDLKRLRDVAEHFDDYALDKGRIRAVGRKALEVSYMDADGPTLTWLGVQLNASDARDAAGRLFKAVKTAASMFPRMER